MVPELLFLKNCLLRFEKGKSTAVVGESGSGKSTLAIFITKSLSFK
jgi:ABC-type bacteriocin/lantibiotic exporter with double-glycine peptidase domain